MKFKPRKSRSLVVRKGKVRDETFELAGEKIPTVGDAPVKCLGEKFDATLSDGENTKEIQKQLGARQTVFLELTFPWEERIDEVHERKMVKYKQLVEECQQWGCRTWCFAIEIRCRDFAGQTLCQDLGTLGVVGAERKKFISGESSVNNGLKMIQETFITALMKTSISDYAAVTPTDISGAMKAIQFQVQTDHLCRRSWRLLWNSTETAKEGRLHLMMELDQHSHDV
ncbi:unnamed protein product [Mytilus coruscus]|uniref:Uncharacterized protein n=1 Tax=Mytilus coruscus TaxID=42192 RepID=A0A6J8BC50_MYTCO|nr:unnamed protein product [Mytilus coruscus]